MLNNLSSCRNRPLLFMVCLRVACHALHLTHCHNPVGCARFPPGIVSFQHRDKMNLAGAMIGSIRFTPVVWFLICQLPVANWHQNAHMDSWNLSEQEIRDWAHDPSAGWPDEDWDMRVAGHENAALIFQLADEACPQADFFVHCLYVRVGCFASFAAADASLISNGEIDMLIARAANSQNPDVRRWGERSKAFLANPDAFDRESWVKCGWALDDKIWRTDRDGAN